MRTLLGKFHIDSEAELTLLSMGHVNETYDVRSGQGHFILQRVNTEVFNDPVRLMDNVSMVLEMLPRLRLIDADGKCYVEDESGFWRMFNYVEDSLCFDVLSSDELAYKAGKGLQDFHERLSSVDAGKLHETIPRFIDMRFRYSQLGDAVKADRAGRLRAVSAELDFLLEERKRGNMINDLLKRRVLRCVVTHNDAKLNNMLFSRESGEFLTMIDLDTVMPGTVLYDLGDLIRSSCSSTAEDADEAEFVLPLYKALVEGYLDGNKGITGAERELVAECGRMMTQITAVRFLADYLNGDVYYRTSCPEHNLVRCRNQIALMMDMDRKLG